MQVIFKQSLWCETIHAPSLMLLWDDLCTKWASHKCACSASLNSALCLLHEHILKNFAALSEY